MGASSPKHMVGCSTVPWLYSTLISFVLLIHLYSSNPFRASSIKHFQDGKEKRCDLTKGRWVRDPNGSTYTEQSCPYLENDKSCAYYGKDMDYVNWRWKPDMCELPKFDPKIFLNIVRGKKMAFIGDSLALNQHDSLRCLLSQVEIPTPAFMDAEESWYFPYHNFTIMHFLSRFLVESEQRITTNGSVTNDFNLQIDKPDPSWARKLRGVDIAVISDANWFFRKTYVFEGGDLLGCTYCSDQNQIKILDVSLTIQKALRTALRHISSCHGCSDGMLILLRTISPVHYEHGFWNTKGYCNKTRPENGAKMDDMDRRIVGDQMEEIARVKKEGEMRRGRKRFGVLDVTRAMSMRVDGHPGSHWKKEVLNGYNDCVHWCLPGPIDLWNDLLLAELQKPT